MTKLTKHDTILWINHAIAYFKSIEKNQKDLAKELGIEEARISEMKMGKGTILPSLMNNIIDLCGAPRRNPGRFEHVELYNDLDSFFESFMDVTENRFHRKILSSLKNEKHIEALIKGCHIEGLSSSDINQEKNYSLALGKINELIHNPKFVDLCYQGQKHLLDPTSIHYLKWANTEKQFGKQDALKIGDIYVREKSVFHYLYLVWLFIQKYPDYDFIERDKININPAKDLVPVILTGKRLMIFQANNGRDLPVNKGIEKIWGQLYRYPDLYSYGSPFRDTIENEIDINPDNWEDPVCEVYLSENMNYYLLIHLSKTEQLQIDQNELFEDREYLVKPNDRLAVINCVNSLDLFRQMEEIRKWFGLPEDDHYILKQKIAKAGGYVPGARVLV